MNKEDLIKEGRRVGNSTRLIDFYIQELFEKGEVYCKDHFDHSKSHYYLFKKVTERLEREHKTLWYMNKFEINNKNYYIKIIKEKLDF